MLIVKLTAEENKHYKGAARNKIRADARREALRREERKIRIVGPDGAMIEQFFRGDVTEASRPAVKGRKSAFLGFSEASLHTMRQSIEDTTRRRRDKLPTSSAHCRVGRHFGCEGTILYPGVGQVPCKCTCHGSEKE